jgi:hypothetical protein
MSELPQFPRQRQWQYFQPDQDVVLHAQTNVTSVSIFLPQPKRRKFARAVELGTCIRQNGDTRPRRVHCRILEISCAHDGSFRDLLQSVRAKCSIMPQIKAQVVPSTSYYLQPTLLSFLFSASVYVTTRFQSNELL